MWPVISFSVLIDASHLASLLLTRPYGGMFCVFPLTFRVLPRCSLIGSSVRCTWSGRIQSPGASLVKEESYWVETAELLASSFLWNHVSLCRWILKLFFSFDFDQWQSLSKEKAERTGMWRNFTSPIIHLYRCKVLMLLFHVPSVTCMPPKFDTLFKNHQLPSLCRQFMVRNKSEPRSIKSVIRHTVVGPQA